MISLALDESPEDLADFVEYCWGDATATAGGAARAADRGGAPAPFRFRHVQIGNEQTVDELVGVFAAAVAAMEARAAAIGRGGEVRYVAGSDKNSDDGYTTVFHANLTTLLSEVGRTHSSFLLTPPSFVTRPSSFVGQG